MIYAEILEKIDLSGFPAEIKLSTKKGTIIKGSTARRDVLVIELKTQSRGNPEAPWVVADEQEVPTWHFLSNLTSEARKQELTLEWIFRSIERVILHELKEQFVFDGVRIYDPH